MLRSRYGWYDEYIENMELTHYLRTVDVAWARHLEEAIHDMRNSAFTAHVLAHFIPFTEYAKTFPDFRKLLVMFGLSDVELEGPATAKPAKTPEPAPESRTARAMTREEELERSRQVEERVLKAFEGRVKLEQSKRSARGEAVPVPPPTHKSLSLDEFRALAGGQKE